MKTNVIIAPASQVRQIQNTVRRLDIRDVYLNGKEIAKKRSTAIANKLETAAATTNCPRPRKASTVNSDKWQKPNERHNPL